MKHTSRIGDHAELVAAAWLLRNGYEVFRNVGCTGPADLVVLDVDTGEMFLVDVKQRKAVFEYTADKPSPIAKSPLQIGLKVRFLIVDGNYECKFEE